MKLSISNIAWSCEENKSVYECMHKHGFTGLEIAPTIIFPDQPYSDIERAVDWAAQLREKERFAIASMQSVWYGRTEQIFGTAQERRLLFEYTCQAIDFAEAVGCRHIVFGCPRNRCIHSPEDKPVGIGFFRELGGYAQAHGVVIGMEANPAIYHTNYVNTTAEAIELVLEVDSPGFRLNLDTGTMLHNEEPAELLREYLPLIHHVHISEPELRPIRHHSLHNELAALLRGSGYDGFVSIETGKASSVAELDDTMAYVREVFG